MSDTTTDQPTWLVIFNKVTSNQRFKVVMENVINASGLVALPWVKKWFPSLTIDSFETYIVIGVPMVIKAVIDWYRNNPNNILARGIQVINGGSAHPSSIAKVADAVANAPVGKTI
jgi:hypothetical protein